MATWVVGDIHGCFDDFMTLLNHRSVKKDDKFILLGDIIDRGPKSYEMIKWAMENITEDGKFQMILGNHEYEVVGEFQRIHHYVASNCHSLDDYDILSMDCHYKFDSYMYKQGFTRLSSVEPIINFFKSLPAYKKITITKTNGSKQDFVIVHGFAYRSNVEKMPLENLVWNRDIDFSGSLETDYYEDKDDSILIHGHTPTISINDCRGKLNSILFRERSINLDCGCVFEKYGGVLAMLRLEDYKEVYSKRRKVIK